MSHEYTFSNQKKISLIKVYETPSLGNSPSQNEIEFDKIKREQNRGNISILHQKKEIEK